MTPPSKRNLVEVKPVFNYGPDTVMGELERLRYDVKTILALLTETKKQ